MDPHDLYRLRKLMEQRKGELLKQIAEIEWDEKLISEMVRAGCRFTNSDYQTKP